jgi:hypothetical protein
MFQLASSRIRELDVQNRSLSPNSLS